MNSSQRTRNVFTGQPDLANNDAPKAADPPPAPSIALHKRQSLPILPAPPAPAIGNAPDIESSVVKKLVHILGRVYETDVLGFQSRDNSH
jgi:hypothetical protein